MQAKESEPESSSLRLLILTPTASDSQSIPLVVPFLEVITGTKPSNDVTSYAGYTSHPPLKLRTKYYSSDVSIWCDELPLPGLSPQSAEEAGSSADSSPPPSLEEWKSQILSREAAEVRAVIGGIILILPSSNSSQSTTNLSLASSANLIEAVHALREAIEDESPGGDIASLVVLQSTSPTVTKKSLHDQIERLEDLSLSEGYLGWDFISWDGQVCFDESNSGGEGERNEFGEKTGINRVLEVLEGIDWTASPSFDDPNGEDLDLDDLNIGGDEDGRTQDILRRGMGMNPSSGLDFELQREMMELKMSILESDASDDDDQPQDDEEAQIDELPALLERVVAIREAGAEMSKQERERFAKREITRIMKDMG